MTAKAGKILPKAQIMLPFIFLNRYPTKIDILTANTPGSDCVTAKISMKSLESSQPLFTISLSIRGIMAYPPPIVNIPILAKVKNSVQYIDIKSSPMYM